MSAIGFDVAGLDGGHASATSEQLTELESRIDGRMLCAGDDGWDEAVVIWNGMVASVPALVIQPTSAAMLPPRSDSHGITDSC
jgi:hypothetical protein